MEVRKRRRQERRTLQEYGTDLSVRRTKLLGESNSLFIEVTMEMIVPNGWWGRVEGFSLN